MRYDQLLALFWNSQLAELKSSTVTRMVSVMAGSTAGQISSVLKDGLMVFFLTFVSMRPPKLTATSGSQPDTGCVDGWWERRGIKEHRNEESLSEHIYSN